MRQNVWKIVVHESFCRAAGGKCGKSGLRTLEGHHFDQINTKGRSLTLGMINPLRFDRHTITLLSTERHSGRKTTADNKHGLIHADVFHELNLPCNKLVPALGTRD
jgi:hypothetical protein